MSEPQTPQWKDRELWAPFAGVPGDAPGACPGPLELAAYLDGRAADEQRERLEGHLADCPACRAAVGELRDLLAEPIQAMPMTAESRERVAGLIRPVAPGTAAGPGAPPRHRPWASHALRRGLAAAAAVAVGYVGYATGTRAPRVEESSAIVAEMSFGLAGTSDGAAADDDVLLQAFSEAAP